MVSPYLSRPLRSLRDAIASRSAVSERESSERDPGPAAGPIAPAGSNAGPPAEADPVAPCQAFSAITGGVAGVPARDAPRCGDA